MKKMRVCLLFALFFGLTFQAHADSLADQFYLRGDYDLAQIEYERELKLSSDADQTLKVQTKIALCLMHRNNYAASLQILDSNPGFPAQYLALYAALRSDNTAAVLNRLRRTENERFPAREEEQMRLLAGAIYLDPSFDGQYTAAKDYYTKIQSEATDSSVRLTAGQILSSLGEYEMKTKKSGWVAGSLAAILPGSGHLYAGHAADAASALFFNVMFLGSAATLYSLEQKAHQGHVASGIVGVIGLFFYLANISGAVAAANRYNLYQERAFHEALREKVFNLERIEKLSSVQFLMRFER